MPTLSEELGNFVLKLGDQGSLVRMAQVELAKRGYALKGTGWFGNATDTAVQTFQKRAGLIPDGEIGPLTAKAIDTTPVLNKFDDTFGMLVSRPLWLEAGIKLIGVKETAGSGDTKAIIDWAKAEGGNIAKEFKHDLTPWCALFANHILTKVGLKGTETLWALDFAGKWPSVKLGGPAVGAFAPMTRKTPTGTAGHIGVVVGKDQHGNYMLLGGNQKDMVSIEPFASSRLNKGFYWPKSIELPKQIGFSSLPIVKSNGQLSSNEA